MKKSKFSYGYSYRFLSIPIDSDVFVWLPKVCQPQCFRFLTFFDVLHIKPMKCMLGPSQKPNQSRALCLQHEPCQKSTSSVSQSVQSCAAQSRTDPYQNITQREDSLKTLVDRESVFVRIAPSSDLL